MADTMKKTKYNLWQNTGFMLCLAWKLRPSVIYICVALALMSAGSTVTGLLLAPSLLLKLETRAPLPELLITIGLFCGGLMIFDGLLGYLQENTLFGRVEVRTNLLMQIGSKLARTSYTNLLDTEFISSMNKAYQTCDSNSTSAEAIWNTWVLILSDVMGFLVYLLLLSGLNPFLIAVVILTTTAGFLLGRRLNEWGYRHRFEEAAYEKQMNYICQTGTQRNYAKDIRIFGLRTWLTDIWDDVFRLYQSFLARRETAYLLTNVIDILLTLLRNGAAYAYLIDLTIKEGLPASSFLLYFTAVSGFTQWITEILEQFARLHQQSLDISALREYLEWPEPFRFEDGKTLAPSPDGNYELRLEDVSFRYPNASQDTLSHINLTIRPGEKTAIVGSNGAGKTTLVKLACGFLDPTRGRVLLNGEDIRQYDRRDYYRLFSAVFQNFSVLEASVAENIAQQTENIDMEKVRICLEKSQMTETVEALPHSLDTKIGRQIYEDGVELSGGQMQKLMLARAFYKDAPVIVLDEPTASLDPIAENEIYLKYNEMTEGRTALFISHRLASTRFCDRILFLEQGRIIEEGTHESLLSLNGRYAELFEIQSRYYKDSSTNKAFTESAPA